MKRLFAILWAVMMLAGFVDSGASKAPENPPPANPATPAPAAATPKPAAPVRSIVIFRPVWLDKCNSDHDARVTRLEYVTCYTRNVGLYDEDHDAALIQKELDAAAATEKKKFNDKALKTQNDLDADKDGKLNLAESKLKTQEDFDKLDLNKDGFIDASEYTAATDKVWPNKFLQDFSFLPYSFRMVDANSDGKITEPELKEAAGRSFDSRDLNGDGLIDGTDAEIQAARNKAATQIPPNGGNPSKPPPLPP